jgi:hypothetical protein
MVIELSDKGKTVFKVKDDVPATDKIKARYESYDTAEKFYQKI